MGKKTPIAEKVRKSTPKTLPKKLINTPSNMNVTLDSKQASFRRAKRDLNSDSIDIASICTPNRTTRSMARHVPGDMLPPIPSFVTPSKRRTIATTENSAKKSLAKMPDNASNGEFVRPRTPKIKVNDVTLVNDTTIDEPIAATSKPKRQSVKARKASNVPEKQATESSGDDLPSVSILGRNSSAKKTKKSVRARKSHESNNDIGSTDDETLPSVSMLGKNSSAKKAGKSDRNRKSLVNKMDVETTDDEDLPSVSILVTKNSPGRYARSPQWLEDNAIEPNQDENVLNNSKASARKSRKSFAIASPAIQSHENGSNDVDNDHNELSNGKEAMTAVSAIENGSKTEITSETTNEVPVAAESKSTRRSKQKGKDHTESSDDGLPSVSFLSTQLKSARKSVKRKAELANESMQKDASPVKRTVKFTSPIIIENPQSDVEASFGNESDKRNESEEMAEQNHAEVDKKPLIKNRVSVIDLTDSPVNSNRTLNTTFSPKVQPTASDAGEPMDRTFTEEDSKAILEKTFSPVPSTSLNVAYSTPLLVLGSPSKPMSKKKSPLLKRLKGTPIRKPTNNLNTPGKLSSAKKMKMVETAMELCDSSAKSKQMLPPKMNASTPKLFRFGADDDKGHDFRFSLLAPSLNPNNPQSNNKSAVKPMPNFKNIHGRQFKKAESIDEACKNRENRAQLLLSGKKPTPAQRKAQKEEKVETEKKAKEIAREVVKKREIKNVIREPLGHINRARLNDEQRQERRQQLFKQAKRQSIGKKKKAAGNLEGVRLNRRFELLMKMRSK